jgi:hypothetical protein
MTNTTTASVAVDPVARILAVARDRSGPIAICALIAALAVFIVFHAIELPKMGLWTDELFSLWAGDPKLSFGEAFGKRILPDTNAPFYFSAVWFAQAAGFEGRVAFLVVNLPLIAIALGLMIWRGRLAGHMTLALWCAALFLVSAPVLSFASEGRVYGVNMALAALMAFIVGIRVIGPAPAAGQGRTDAIVLAACGVLGAWMHIYGAMFAGALGAGAMAAGWFVGRRRDLIVLGLTTGIATTVAFAVWLAVAFPVFSTIAQAGFWMEFTVTWVIETFWFLKQFVVGVTAVVPFVAAFLIVSLALPGSRAPAILTVVTMVLFTLIPMAVSFHTAIFGWRYLIIGMPAFLILCVVILHTHLATALSAPRSFWPRAAAAAGLLFAASATLTGVPNASWLFGGRWDWRGIDVIRPLVQDCPEGELRVLKHSSGDKLSGFSYLLRGALKPVNAETAPLRDVADINCPVLGWGEHNIDPQMGRDWAEKADIPTLLEDFHLTNTAGAPLEVKRHTGGLVLLRAKSE